LGIITIITEKLGVVSFIISVVNVSRSQQANRSVLHYEAVLESIFFELCLGWQNAQNDVFLRISSAVAEVDVHDLCISVAGRDLLKDAHLKLCPGQRYGFVGRNGSGKSTLFRSMASGRIPGYPANCVTLLVDQEDVGDERTAVETATKLS
jgi:ABC-type bacteriocin/lantibiotic exporter with double-glycine peptidase domain